MSVQIVVYVIGALLLVLSVMGLVRIDLGLNQNVSLIKGSDTFTFFDVFDEYGEVGPPAYLVFRNVNYSKPENLEAMADITDNLSELNDTVIKPVYSWVKTFQQYRNPNGEWAPVCGTAEAINLGFDEAMAKFVTIKVDTDCCQRFGVCGEQYVGDIAFDDEGRVTATRFRFQHTMLHTQDDYIKALVETRRVADEFADKIVPNDSPEEGAEDIAETKTAYSYSLFYVYYDQYTYIRGVLVQNTLLALAAVLLAIEIITNLGISLFVALCVLLVSFNLIGCMYMCNVIFGGYVVEMNAVMVVNIVMSLGLAVEFCVHIAISFNRQTGTRLERAKKAVHQMGSSVLVGIASTKFIGKPRCGRLGPYPARLLRRCDCACVCAVHAVQALLLPHVPVHRAAWRVQWTHAYSAVAEPIWPSD